jgi:hypothetical protein
MWGDNATRTTKLYTLKYRRFAVVRWLRWSSGRTRQTTKKQAKLLVVLPVAAVTHSIAKRKQEWYNYQTVNNNPKHKNNNRRTISRCTDRGHVAERLVARNAVAREQTGVMRHHVPRQRRWRM